MPDLSAVDDVCNEVSYLARIRIIDRIFPLDDYDVPTAAALREHLRLPGMGINLWRERARLEILGERYRLPQRDYRYAGVILR